MHPKNHNFFNKIKYEINNRLPYIELKKNWTLLPVKSMLIRDMMKIKFKYWEVYFLDFIWRDIYDLEKEQVKAMFLNRVYEVINKYEEKWRQVGVDDIIVCKFKKWHSESVQMFIEAITSIFDGNSYSSVYEKINACLDVFISLIHLSTTIAEQTLHSLNWQISWKLYKWNTIE